jgi:hypothetical protein
LQAKVLSEVTNQIVYILELFPIENNHVSTLLAMSQKHLEKWKRVASCTLQYVQIGFSRSPGWIEIQIFFSAVDFKMQQFWCGRVVHIFVSSWIGTTNTKTSKHFLFWERIYTQERQIQ